jgi:hypothetical protein
VRVKIFEAGDLKLFLPGAAVALTAGLMLGGAMQPHLDDGDGRPAGPQIVAGWETGRSTGPFDQGMTLAAYHGQVPDYVLGTDWKKSMAWPDERAAVSPPSQDVASDDPAPDEAPATLTRAAYEEPAPAPHAYPSLGGAGPKAHAATDADVAADDDTLPADEAQPDDKG